MNKVMYRIHFRSGLSIDVCEETDKDNIIDVWKSIFEYFYDKPVSDGNFWAVDSVEKGKCYLYRVDDIVAFERL